VCLCVCVSVCLSIIHLYDSPQGVCIHGTTAYVCPHIKNDNGNRVKCLPP